MISQAVSEIWPLRVGGPQKIQPPLGAPLGVVEPKNLGFLNNSIGATYAPKINKIDEMRVPTLGDLTWNDPPTLTV